MRILLTERSKHVLRLAQQEAYSRGQSMIQPDHLRLALLGYLDADAYLELSNEGFSLDSLEAILTQIEDSLPRFRTKIPIPEMYLAPETIALLVRATTQLNSQGYLHLTPRMLFQVLFEK
jgi:ATP-dependent Clp protease ATP-binding subunit ClpA